MEYSCVYRLIDSEGHDQTLGTHQAIAIIKNTAISWHKHCSKWGDLYTEVHQWAISIDGFGEERQHPPRLRNGGSARYNEFASRFFEIQIYGSCLIRPYVDKGAELGVALLKAKGG